MNEWIQEVIVIALWHEAGSSRDKQFIETLKNLCQKHEHSPRRESYGKLPSRLPEQNTWTKKHMIKKEEYIQNTLEEQGLLNQKNACLYLGSILLQVFWRDTKTLILGSFICKMEAFKPVLNKSHMSNSSIAWRLSDWPLGPDYLGLNPSSIT